MGHQRQCVIDPLLILVHGKHLMVQLLQLGCHVAAKAPQSDQQY